MKFLRIISSTFFSICSFLVFSQNLTYHLFQFQNKIGIINSNGEITLNPKYDNREYYIRGFNNTNHSKYLLIYNNETHKSGLIDIHGKEYFKNIEKIRYDDNGQFAAYYDDDTNSMGLHILSIPEEKELIYFKERASIEFHGKREYFFSTVHDGKWKIYNNKGIKIYELGGTKEIDEIEDNGKFLALALSRNGGSYLEYINKEGEFIKSNGSDKLSKLFQNIIKIKDKEEEIFYDYPSDCIIRNNKIKQEDFEKIECKKYNSGQLRFICTRNGKKGVLDENGNTVIELKYDNVQTMSKYFKTYINNRIGLSDLNGKVIFPNIFDSIKYEPTIENYMDVKYIDYLFEASFDGKIFAPKKHKI
jgi:hypothetical protein